MHGYICDAYHTCKFNAVQGLLENPTNTSLSLIGSCKQQMECDSMVLLLRAITAAAMAEVPGMDSWALTMAMDAEHPLL